MTETWYHNKSYTIPLIVLGVMIAIIFIVGARQQPEQPESPAAEAAQLERALHKAALAETWRETSPEGRKSACLAWEHDDDVAVDQIAAAAATHQGVEDTPVLQGVIHRWLDDHCVG